MSRGGWEWAKKNYKVHQKKFSFLLMSVGFIIFAADKAKVLGVDISDRGQVYALSVMMASFLMLMDAVFDELKRVEEDSAEFRDEFISAKREKSVNICKTQFDADNEIMRFIVRNKCRSAMFFHYSGYYSSALVQRLIDDGASVQVYISSPGSSEKYCSNFQADRIVQSVEGMKNMIRNQMNGNGRLRIYNIAVPITVRASCIDNKIIAMGWYVYRPGNSENDEKNEILIDQSPNILVKKGCEGFDEIYRGLIDIKEKLQPVEIYDSEHERGMGKWKDSTFSG